MTNALRLPDFLLVGAMKAGTTTLHDLLAQHPGIFMSRFKEPAFFSREERYKQGLAHYGRLFEDAAPGQLCGESSTCYSRWPHYGDVASRIAGALPDARLLYLMRHPVERAYSHYRHRMIERYVDRSAEVVSFEEALEEHDEYRDASLYAMQIGRFLAHYPSDRILLLTTDELHADPSATCAKIHSFLAVPVEPPRRIGRENEFDERFARRATNQRVQRLGETRIGRVAAALVPHPARHQWREWVSAAVGRFTVPMQRSDFDAKVSPLTPETRRRLLADFRAPNLELESSLGVKLPAAWSE